VKASLAYRRRTDYLRTVRDIVSSGIHFHSSHEKMLERLQERVYSRPKYQKLPARDRAYIAGATDQMFSDIYLHLEFRHFYNGEWLTWDAIVTRGGGRLPLDFSAYLDADGSLEGTHFWRGTDKMYSTTMYKRGPNGTSVKVETES
jgi:hypothetical protein